jgi:PAS domain S-box-containing protein
MFVNLPAVLKAYEIAHCGNMDDPHSPQSQEARELLRKELAPILDSYKEEKGDKLQLHFHLPNSLSLVRLWWEKNTRINGEWTDISDDLTSYRPTVMDVNKYGIVAMGIEPGTGGFAVRGVIPVKAPDGRQLGSAEVLQNFDAILDSAVEEGKFEIVLYANEDLLRFSVELRDREKHPRKGEFVRVTEALDESLESMITAEMLLQGKKDSIVKRHGPVTMEVFPINDYRGNQVGVMVFVINTETISGLMNTAAVTLALMLAAMAIAPSFSLLFTLRMLVTIPLKKIREKIQDIAEERANLVEPIITRQKDEIGELARWFNTLTAKVGATSAKFESMARWYESILDATPLPISVTDADMNWTFANRAVEEYLGIKRKDMLGKPCNNWDIHICNTPDCSIAQAKCGTKQTFFRHKGRSHQVDIEILKSVNGEIEGFIEIVQDITEIEELVKKQAEAEAASKLKSVFLANMSHEIRTPMNAIIGITEIQLQNTKLPPDIKEALARIHNSGVLLLGIINDILDLSKIEAGKMELAPVKYNISNLINDVVQLNRLRFEGKPIEFRLMIDEKIPAMLTGDDLRVKQILNNLLSNAFKYTEKGMISFSVAAEQMSDKNQVMLVFRISDTGQGMSEDQVKMLFDEYSRFNLDANRVTEGTGLGMTITRNLLRLMDGTIFIESEKGRGTEVTIHLPQKTDSTGPSGILGSDMAEKLQQLRVESAAEADGAQITRKLLDYGSVLVVDDNESNLFVARALLEPYKLSIDTASGGQESIEKIANGNVYDIIFMDHMMPGMDGIEAVKKIRGMQYNHAIIALTANALVGQAEMFLENGFDSFISKPIDIKQLDMILGKFIHHKQPD